MTKKKSLRSKCKMKQDEIRNVVEEIFADARSLKEDVEYGLKNDHKILLSNKEQSELHEISDKLTALAESVGVQFIIQDFE